MRFSSRRILSFARRKRRLGLSNKAGGLTMTKPDPVKDLNFKRCSKPVEHETQASFRNEAGREEKKGYTKKNNQS
jgi:hypothetical protein